MKDDVRAFWEAEACGERYRDEQEQLRYELEPEILDFAAFAGASGLDVLEIGVGMGADFLRWLRAGARATGIDLTERAVALAGQWARAEGFEADLRVAAAEALPFDDDHFDLVYTWGVLHHTPDVPQAFREAIRVLKPWWPAQSDGVPPPLLGGGSLRGFVSACCGAGRWRRSARQ